MRKGVRIKGDIPPTHQKSQPNSRIVLRDGFNEAKEPTADEFILVFRSTKPCLATRRVSPTRVPRGIMNAASTRDQPAPSILGCGECT